MKPWLASAILLSIAAPAGAAPLRATASLNCRATPSSFGMVVARIPRGRIVDGAGRSGEWTHVNGAPSCWAATRYFKAAGKGAATKPPLRLAHPVTRNPHPSPPPARIPALGALLP